MYFIMPIVVASKKPLIQNQKQIEKMEQLKKGTNRLDIRVAKASEYP